jgi:hypothetical protein
MPNRAPEDYAAECNPKIAEEWRTLAAEYERIALIVESQGIKAKLDPSA